jgi:hypothetical protein
MDRTTGRVNPGSKTGRKVGVFEQQFRRAILAMRDDFSRRRALVDGVSVCEDALALFDEYLAALDQVLVTPAEGALISDYHADHLTRLVRQGKIEDLRAKGSKGRILIRLSDLPRKPGHSRPDISKVSAIAERMFNSRKRQ